MKRTEGVDLRGARIDSIDALIQAAQLARDIYKFQGAPARTILKVLLTREQFDQTRARFEQQTPFGDWVPRDGVIRWNNMDLYAEKPHCKRVKDRWEATPASVEPDDIMAAYVAEKALNGLHVGEVR
jgi:hypothetical protein